MSEDPADGDETLPDGPVNAGASALAFLSRLQSVIRNQRATHSTPIPPGLRRRLLMVLRAQIDADADPRDSLRHALVLVQRENPVMPTGTALAFIDEVVGHALAHGIDHDLDQLRE